MPVPTHLKECVIPDSPMIDESALKAKVQCSCGGMVFELFYPGQTHENQGKRIPCVAKIKEKFFFLIKVKCVALRERAFTPRQGLSRVERLRRSRPKASGIAASSIGGLEMPGVRRTRTQGCDYHLDRRQGGFHFRNGRRDRRRALARWVRLVYDVNRMHQVWQEHSRVDFLRDDVGRRPFQASTFLQTAPASLALAFSEGVARWIVSQKN